MKIAIDFDSTIIEHQERYDDIHGELRLMPGAKEALTAMRDAGHTLILFSARANRALREDWKLNPLWRDGKVRFDVSWWKKNQPINQGRYEQMLRFVEAELPGIFDAIDDGHQGKPMVDRYIDDRALTFMRSGLAGYTWFELAQTFGENEGA